MRHSIRTRITFIFIGLTVLILLAVWAANTWLLEDYYVQDKIKILEKGYTSIDTILQKYPLSELEPYSEGSNADELSEVLKDLGDRYNTTIVLVDNVTGNAVVSSARDKNFLVRRLLGYALDQSEEPVEVIRKYDNYVIQRSYNPLDRSADLEAWGFFSDNTTLFIMSIPLSSVWESVDLSNRFLLIVGSIVMVLGSLIIYLVIRKITLPIMDLAKLSEEMTNLNFDMKYTGQQQDEIGILGRNMNEMSDRLKETITELKEANDQLQKDINEKIQIDEMRKEFIANVSHELKTPIALIQGYAEGLTEGMCEDEESRNYYCGVIMDEAVKMNRMVKQLLNLTALEFGNDTPVMETFNLTDVIRGIITSSSILIQQKEAQVIFEHQDPLPVVADEFKIEEVITNYLTNALNHANGEKKIEIRAEELETQVKVTVFNTGDPIPEEDIPKLWTKFYKVDKARTRAYGGSGIGLSIVKAIMESHHQEYGARNVEGGVEFWFTLEKGKEEQE
ncbi:MAG TPA: cell wall metabolism sensor histidine kinase WalK [Candidatus Lachnoclostridium avicola]|nr:cell wall metabolism sensor histidine kinase WalK [Candidatus Lachnoclostridium avicola]